MRFVIFADDFTGAMDTGVQFAQEGIPTGFYWDIACMRKALRKGEKEVYVMNTNTRHLSPDEAYQRLYEYGREISGERPDMVMKKTDSGLRGNIGRELAAVMDSLETETLHFIPSYPGMKRITRQGIHYIDGVPVAESVFGRDPFDAVCISEVGSLIGDAGKRICQLSAFHISGEESSLTGIGVWDAETDQEIESIIEKMMGNAYDNEQGIRLWAGCAGVARALARVLPFQRRQKQVEERTGGLVIICGSVSEVTKKQAEYAEKMGFSRELARIDEFFRHDSRRGQEIRRLSDWVLAEREAGRPCILDTGFPDVETIEGYSRTSGYSVMELGAQIANALGETAAQVYEHKLMDTGLMIIGGDTLQGLMDRLDFDELELIGEIQPGVIMIRIHREGTQRMLLTKSGGFGEEELLIRLWNSYE